MTTLNDESVISMLNNVNKHISSKDIPVILGEFGCVNKNNLDERVRYADLVTRTMELNAFGGIMAEILK